ncbi:MAG TPA: cytochrome c oxidase assembly protein [Solirubrobacteraceae bacterium]|nr:cytochrome c oxidase assembly protein [Solirubrobacteraceae bacterium]
MLAHWSFTPLQVVPVLVIALAYWRRTRRLADTGEPVAWARRASFYAGMLVGLASLVSPIDWLGENRLEWVHMSQHLMLGDLAPLLVVLGLTEPVLAPLQTIGVLRRARVLVHPFVALPLWIVNLYFWHLPVIYQAALAHTGVHALQHFCLAIAGGLMWAAVVEPLPGPQWFGNGHKALYTLVVRAAGMALATLFIWDGQVIYPHYVPLERVAGIAPLTDQRIAGLTMFIEGGIVTLVVIAVLLLRFAQEMEARQRLLERELYTRTATGSASPYRRRT